MKSRLLVRAFCWLGWVFRASVLYRLLGFGYVVVLTMKLSEGVVSLVNSRILLPYLWGFPYVIFFVFLVVCIGVIAGIGWSVGWSRAVGVWVFALIWTGLPEQVWDIHGLWNILVLDVYSLGEVLSDDYWRGQIWDCLTTIIWISSLLFFIKLAQSHVGRKECAFAESVRIGKNRSIQASHFMWVGIVTLLAGLGFKWLEVRIAPQIYAQTIGSYLFVFGTAMLLVWHLNSGKAFLAASGVSIAVIILNCGGPARTCVLSLLLWLPALLPGVICLFRKDYATKLRIVGLGVPVVLMLIALFGHIPMYMCFWSYLKPVPGM